MPGTFSAAVSDWVKDVKEVHTAVFRESAQRVIADMLVPRNAGGRMPIISGFLRASLLASTSQMPTLSATGVKGQTYDYDSGPVAVVLARANLGDTVFAGFTAIYARKVNYDGALFVETAAMKWETIVAQVEAELLQRRGLS